MPPLPPTPSVAHEGHLDQALSSLLTFHGVSRTTMSNSPMGRAGFSLQPLLRSRPVSPPMLQLAILSV